ncbi:hypothetical protein KVR01_000496 [Diaporthe batatas]|uniref:uncharacterized protein n=1 Tax=Diaporthe batatas TaxID=748121 RepID=UPI001D040D90|nr:uncharacterized protein KVR01_000496 [Diaporthe batatas]KAG8169751.1 hypothetical protein KVR01_000496 [Diaporthe batatas]
MASTGNKIHRLGLGRLVVEGKVQSIVRAATLTLKDEKSEKLIVQVHIDGHTLAQWDLVMLRERNLLDEKFFSVTEQKMLQLTLPLFEPDGKKVATRKTIQLFILTAKDFRTAVEYFSTNAGMQHCHIKQVLQDLRGANVPNKPAPVSRPRQSTGMSLMRPPTAPPMRRPQSQTSVPPPVRYSPLQPIYRPQTARPSLTPDDLHRKGLATCQIQRWVLQAVVGLSSLVNSAIVNRSSTWIMMGATLETRSHCTILRLILSPWAATLIQILCNLAPGDLCHQVPKSGQILAMYTMGVTITPFQANLQAIRARPYPQKRAVASKQPNSSQEHLAHNTRRPASSASGRKLDSATETAISSEPQTSEKRPETSLGISRKRKAPSGDTGVSAAVLPVVDKSSTNEPSGRSCMGCRNKKRKCDRSKPACGPCRKDKRPCTYPNIPPTTGHSFKKPSKSAGSDTDSHPMIVRDHHALASLPMLSDASTQTNHATMSRDIGTQSQEFPRANQDIEMKDVGTDPSNVYTDACAETDRCDDVWVPVSQFAQLVLWASDQYMRKVHQAAEILRTTDPSQDDYKDKVAQAAVYAGQFMDEFRDKYAQTLER